MILSMAPDAIRKVAFIGTGLMGAPMVRRLLSAGLKVRVWNRSPEKLKALIDAGAELARSPADVANQVDAVFLCLSDSTAIESVVFSEAGVASAETAPSLLVDFSTIGPTDTVALAERLRSRCGTAWVDAPVSGGAMGAEQGKLVIFCGGMTADIDRLIPAFGALAQRYTHVGNLGAGQTLKLCNQLIVAANLVAIAEALALARASAMDLAMLPQALAGGFADSLPLQIFGTRMANGATSPVLGELSLMLKDMNAIANLAGKHQQQLPIAAAALEVYRLADRKGLLRQDLAALFDLHPRPIP
jgi:3-hydroxyisobutyrate dehydrogenase